MTAAVAVAALRALKPACDVVSGYAHALPLPATGSTPPQVRGLFPVAEIGSGTATGSAAAATGQPAPWWVVPALVGITLAAAGGYAIACWWWPYAACARCKGSGRIASPTGRRFRLCPKCKASGRRLRAGRRISNYFRRDR